MSTCKSCNAAVLFVCSVKGGNMCLNAEPDAQRGNVAIDRQGDGLARVLGGGLLREARTLGRTLYLSHHATCEFAHLYGTKARSPGARQHG